MIALADVEALVARRFAEALNSDDLDAAVAAGVRFYSRYNPVYVTATLDLVADIRAYDLPVDFLILETFDWWPDGEVTPEGTRDALWDGAYRQSVAEQRVSEVTPTVRLAAGQVILDAAPTEAETINYAYYGLHQADGGEFANIPADDLLTVSDLVSAELLDTFGVQTALDPDYAEGLLNIKSRGVVSNITKHVATLRAGVKARYGGY